MKGKKEKKKKRIKNLEPMNRDVIRDSFSKYGKCKREK